MENSNSNDIVNSYSISNSLLDSLNKPVLYKIVENFMIFCAVYPFILLVSFINDLKNITPGLMLIESLIIVPTILCAVIRYFSKNIFIYLLGCIPLFFVTFFIGTTVLNKLVLIVFMVVLVLSDIIISQKYRKLSFLLVLELLSLGSMIIFYRYKFLVNLSLTLNLLLFISYLYYMFFSRNKMVKLLSKNTTSFPKEKIKRIRQKASAIIGIVTVVLWVISLKIGGILNNMINKFLSVDESRPCKPPHELNQNAQVGKSNNNLLTKNLLPKVKSHSDGSFVRIIGFIVIAVVLICLVTYIILYFKNNYSRYKKEDNGEETESLFSFEDMQHKIQDKFKNAVERLKSRMNVTNRNEIRNAYKKTIKSYMKRDVEISESDTPMEIKDEIKNKKQADISRLTLIYEKARYDKAEPSDEDVKVIKELVKELK